MAAKNSNGKSVNTDFSEEGKRGALEEALNQIKKTYGQGAIMKLGDESARLNVEAISTGSMSLDVATGIGGVPRGRIIEIYGPESSGKTTLTLHIVAEAQKRGGRAAFIDAEHALDPEYARNLGVNVDELLVSQPDTGEQGLDICEMLVRSGALDVVVVDSVAALVPSSEIQGVVGESFVGVQARMMSQAMRKLAGVINRSKTAVIFINQLREKIGVSYGYGPAETTTGRRALKFYASMRLDVRKAETLKIGDSAVGNRVRVKVVKNKVAPPFKTAEFDIMFGKGISVVGDVVDAATEQKIINKSGSWYSYNGQKIGQGRENAKIYLEERPELLEEIREQVWAKLKPSAEEEPQGEAEAAPSGELTDDEVADIMDLIIDEDGVIVE